MGELGIQRLRQLRDHIRSGNLAHINFNMNIIDYNHQPDHKCGTDGCMFGEFPQVFPEFWEFVIDTKLYTVCEIGKPHPTDSEGLVSGIARFLEIHEYEVMMLFFKGDAFEEARNRNYHANRVDLLVKRYEDISYRRDCASEGEFSAISEREEVLV